MDSSHFSQTSQTPPKLTLLCYILGLCERIKRVCQRLEVKTVCRSRSTLKNALVQVKQPSEDRKKKAVVYGESCKGCERVYNRETSKTHEQRAQECSEESQHQQWTCSTGLDQLMPSGLEGCQDKRNGRNYTGRGRCWKPCTSTNSSTPQTWTINPSWLPLLDNPACS